MTEEEYRKYKEERRKMLGLPSLPVREVATPEPEIPDYTISSNTTPEVPQEVIDAYSQVQGEIEEGSYITGTALSVAGELGLGIGLSRQLHKSQKYLKWINGARRVSMAGILAPEPSTTVAGVVGLAATEAGIWGLSNLIGQQIRQGFGLEDEYSVGEGIAASVFGVGIVTKAADKVFKLGPGIGAANAWKGQTALVNGVETFISGGALGIAESALRQEIEAQMNGKERNTYDYLFSGIAGGAFNTLFSVWGRTGKWGRDQANEAASNAKKRLLKDKADLIAKQNKIAGRAGAASRRKIQGEINKIDQAVEVIDDGIREIKGADEILTKQEQEAVAEDLPEIKKEDQGPILEAEDISEIKKQDEEVVASKDLEEETTQAREAEEEVVEEPAKPEEQPDVVEKEALPRFVDDEREGAFDALVRQTETYGFVNIADNRRMTRISQRLYERSNQNFEIFSKRLREDITDIDTIQEFLNEVKFLRKLNNEIRYPLGLAAGGGVQAFKGDSDKFAWRNDKASYANQLEDASYAKLEADLEIALGKGTLSEDADILKQHNEYVEVDEPKPAPKDEADLEIEDTMMEAPVSSEVDVEAQTAEEVTRKLSKRKDGLKQRLKKLEEAREEFVGLREEVAPKKAKAKTPEEADIQNRLAFYRTAKKEAKETALLENRLERYFELLEEGDIEKIRQEVGPAPDWAKPKEIESYLGKLRSVVNKTKKLLQKELIDEDEVLRLKEADALARQKQRLEGRLEQLQERFGDRAKIQPKEKKEVKVDPEVAELKQRIKFYEEAEADALEVERLEAELAKVAELDVAPLGEQRAAVTPKPTGPQKPDTRASELRSKIAKVKANIKQRLADIDKARLEMSDEFQAAKAEAAFQKKINGLQAKLDELRATFAKEPEELVPGKPKEKDPKVKDLEDKIKFYKDAQSEARKIKELEAERARLLEVETGPLGRQREEITPKPTGPKKAPGRVEELNKDIAFLRSNMRNRIREIDRARVEMSDEYKAEQLRQAYEKKKNQLETELDELRERFGRTPEDVETKPAKELEPEFKELKDKINYYKQAEREITKIIELEKELARVADIEGRSVMGELRAETAVRPKGPTKPLKSAELRKKITASKRRMRKKLADIDKAAQQIKDEELRLEVFKDMEDAIFKSMDVDAVNTTTKVFRWVKQARQLALIDQLPSVLAGVPTGIGAVYKRFWKPLSRYIVTRMEGGSADVSKKMAAIEAQAAFKVISIQKDLLVAMKRSFQQNIDVTDKMRGKLATDINRLPQGEAALLNKAYRSAKQKQEGLDNLGNYFVDTIINGHVMDLLSLGVRGIQTVDAVFKRQLIKGDIYAASQQKALLNNPKDSAKAIREAEDAYKKAWIDDDGLEVLASHHEFQDRVDKVRQELLFAANTDDLDLASGTYVTEKIIGLLKDLSSGDGLPGTVINAFLPYIGVPIRAVYRGSRLVGSPALLLSARTKNNPYNRRLAEVKQKMAGLQMTLNRDNITPEMKQNAMGLMQELREESTRLTSQRTEYNVDILTDTFVATSLAVVGYGMATSGMMTGSLAWLTDDQRQKTKLEPFKALDSDYSAALPWSFPLALAADVGAFLKIRAEEDATGSKILTKDQTLIHVVKNSLKELAKEMPLAQGARNFEELIDGDGEVFTRAMYSLATSYFPYPAQFRKFMQAYENIGEAAVNDLRGGDYKDRLLYSIFGRGIVNKKTDHFGYDIQSNRTFMTEAVIRQAPRKSIDRTQFDDILAADTHENIQRKPSTLGPGIKFTDFRDSDGMTLSYAFDLKLRDTKIRIKGKNRVMEDAIYDLINSTKWNKKFEQGFKPSETRPDVYINEGLRELNALMQQYYRRTKEDLLKDKDYLYDFVGPNDKSLIDIIEELKQPAEETGRPASIRELLTLAD
jgi:hypothetical protein